MERSNRPLSPHLGIYRFDIQMTLSILHRGTGLALSVGLMLFVWWLVALATSPAYYEFVTGVLGSPLFRLFFIGWAFSFFYHLANGIRHLCWDAGWGFERSQIRASSWIALGAALLATAWFTLAVII